MKYIISESQYIYLINENTVEFPGIKFFGGNWNFVEKSLNNLTFKGKKYSDIEDLKKDYFISEINNMIPDVENLDVRNYDNYYGVVDVLGSFYPYKRTSPTEFHEFDRLFHNTALVSIYDDTIPEDPQWVDNYEIRYKNLDNDRLEEFYEYLLFKAHRG